MVNFFFVFLIFFFFALLLLFGNLHVVHDVEDMFHIS